MGWFLYDGDLRHHRVNIQNAFDSSSPIKVAREIGLHRQLDNANVRRFALFGTIYTI